jgi:hypothetical protein
MNFEEVKVVKPQLICLVIAALVVVLVTAVCGFFGHGWLGFGLGWCAVGLFNAWLVDAKLEDPFTNAMIAVFGPVGLWLTFRDASKST